MCGNVGVAGNIWNKEDKALKTLLILDAVRGIDSTGIAAIGKDGDTRVVKAVGNPYELLEHRMFQPALNRSNRAIIGHNRYATQGEVNRKNAHPFDFDTLVGCHNGTLKTKHKLLDSNLFKVDSENLFHHIEQKGLDNALTLMDGAWALVWWDKETEELNFLRNKERPLCMVESVDRKALFWASESWMLDVACDRAEIAVGAKHFLVEDMHYCIPISKDGIIGKAVVRHRPSTYVAPVYQPQVHQGNFQHAGATSNTSASSSSTPKAELMLVPEKKRTEAASADSSKQYYVNSKGVRLELVSLSVDSAGATYVDCCDIDTPAVNVRIYYKKGDAITSNIGKLVTADIKDIKLSTKEGKYYKVARDTVRVVDTERIDVRKIVDAITSPEEPEELFIDHRNNPINKENFIAAYSCCACCDGYVDPEQTHKFTTSGDALCHECVNDKELVKYFNLVS